MPANVPIQRRYGAPSRRLMDGRSAAAPVLRRSIDRRTPRRQPLTGDLGAFTP